MNAIERAARVAALSRKLENAVKEKDWNAAATVAAAINVHTSFLHDLASELRAETAIPALPAPEPEKKGKGARPFYPRPGHMTRYVTRMVEDIQPGDGKVIPYLDGYDARRLQASVTSICSRQWGTRTYLTTLRPDGIELVRLK